MRSHQLPDYVASLFDVVGTSRLPSGDTLLILGLESTSQRNLDEFGRSDGEFQLYGFEKHIDHRLRSIVSYIRRSGFSAEPVGWLGYPRRGELNLKDEAIRAGLGRRGKSTIVLHPKYGPRLRFTAIRTDYPMEAPPGSCLTEEENPTCSECSICIDACPAKALEPYRMPDPSLCLSNSANMTQEQGRLVPCDICLSLCPAARGK
ncbi:MAG: epoxyqueuosine reductase [Chloroflexi bacterium]|nr:epoxyqueuosine reductase [Chloroflexota bacterium]